MTTVKIRHYYFLLLILACSACIREFTFEPSEPPFLLVVDGRITTNDGKQTLRISRTTTYGSQVTDPVTGASVRLLDDLGVSISYYETPESPGLYRIDRFKGQPGRQYHIEIRLSDERSYRSEPELLPEVVEADTLTYSTTFENFQNQSGTIQDKWFMNVFVQSTLQPQEKGPFLRWEVETVHNFIEVLGLLPPPRPYICYITKIHNPQDILLFDGSGISAAQTIEKQVGRKRINWELDWKHYFNVYQHSLSEKAYRYWLNIRAITAQSGTIFDPPPAPVRGNIYNIDDEDELVLGYFGASAVDTIRLVTFGPDFGEIPVESRCGDLFRRPYPLPRECTNCIILPNSSYLRPDYF